MKSLLVLLAVVSAALGQMANYKQNMVDKCASGGSAWGPGRGRIFLIAVGHDYGAYDYIDAAGYNTGFMKDVIRSVCQEAGIQCRMVWDRYPNCWTSTAGEHSYGGVGLHGGYYDACAGWWVTVDRIHVFDFSMPFLKMPNSFFYVKAGTAFNPLDITGKTIGFMDGWATDEKCVARQTIKGHYLPKAQVKHMQGTKEAIDKLNDGTIDAFFTSEETMTEVIKTNTNIQKMSTVFNCFIAGNSMMTRKDNDFNSYWNVGFNALRSNGKFAKLCAEGMDKHGKVGPIECLGG